MLSSVAAPIFFLCSHKNIEPSASAFEGVYRLWQVGVFTHAIVLLSFYHPLPPPTPPNLSSRMASSRPTRSQGGPYQSLSALEITWRDRQQFLQSKGYMLRPRLRPGWTPSWLQTGTYWRRAEDSVELPVSRIGSTRESSYPSCYRDAHCWLMQLEWRTESLSISSKLRLVTRNRV